MKSHRWMVLLAVGVLALVACAQAQTETAAPESRYRAWLLFKVENPAAAAKELEGLMDQGGGAYVVIRADVVNGDFNLVVPVDTASQSEFESLLEKLTEMVGGQPTVLVVDEHHPIQTTKANSFVTEAEREGLKKTSQSPVGKCRTARGPIPGAR